MGKLGYYRRRLGGCIMLFACIALAAGCGGDASRLKPAELEAGIVTAPAEDSSQIAETFHSPPLPQDEPLDPSEFEARRSNYTQVQVRLGDDFHAHNPNAAVNPTAHVMQLIAGPRETAWAVYRFDSIAVADLPALVSVELLPAMTERLYFGLPDYERGTWRWQHLPAGIGGYNLGISETMHALSLGGSLHMALLCYDDDTAVITRLTCTTEVTAPPPVGLEASDGTHARIIYLSWEDPAVTYPGLEYESVIIERAFWPDYTYAQIAEVAAGVTSYEDIHSPPANEIPFDSNVLYRLRTVADGAASAAGIQATGRRVLLPVTYVSASDGLYYDRVEISWEPSPGADKYWIGFHVYGWGGIPEPWFLTEVVGASNTSLTHTLSSQPDNPCYYGMQYIYYVEPWIDNWHEGLYASDGGYRILQPPVNLTASVDRYSDRIELGWDKADGATGYVVYRDGTGLGNVMAETGDVDSWSDYGADSEQHTYSLRSTTTEHTSGFSTVAVGRRSQWLTYALPGGCGLSGCPLAIVDGRPAISFVLRDLESGLYSVEFAHATSPVAASSDDWIVHTVDDAMQSATSIELAVVAGKPALVYGQWLGPGEDIVVRYTRALSAAPASSDDWQISNVVDDCGDHPSQCSLIELDGRPAVAFYGSMFAHASSAEPSSSEDWNVYQVDSGYGAFGSMILNGDKPVIAHGEHSRVCLASTSTPTSAADWLCYSITERHIDYDGWLDLAEVNGKLAVAFMDGLFQLTYTRALSNTPTTISDWAEHVVVFETVEQFEGGSLVEFLGVPAIAYSRSATVDYGSIVEFAIAGVAEPSSAADWALSTIQFAEQTGYDISYRANLLPAGGTLMIAYDNCASLAYGVLQ